jgi:hypothetical protein
MIAVPGFDGDRDLGRVRDSGVEVQRLADGILDCGIG